MRGRRYYRLMSSRRVRPTVAITLMLVILFPLAACAAEHDLAIDRIVGDKQHEMLALLRRIIAELD